MCDLKLVIIVIIGMMLDKGSAGNGLDFSGANLQLMVIVIGVTVDVLLVLVIICCVVVLVLLWRSNRKIRRRIRRRIQVEAKFARITYPSQRSSEHKSRAQIHSINSTGYITKSNTFKNEETFKTGLPATIEIHQLALTNDSQDQELDHSISKHSTSHTRPRDDHNKTHKLTKGATCDKENNIPENSCKGNNDQSADVAYTQSDGETQPGMVTHSNGSHTCNTEVQTVENPFYIRGIHLGIHNGTNETAPEGSKDEVKFPLKRNSSSSITSIPTANLSVTSDVREPKSDAYVEMRSVMKDDVRKVNVPNKMVATQPAATLNRDPYFTDSQENKLSIHCTRNQESSKRVKSKLRRSASWSDVSNAPVYHNFMHKGFQFQESPVKYSTGGVVRMGQENTDSCHKTVAQVQPLVPNSQDDSNIPRDGDSICDKVSRVQLHKNSAHGATVSYNRGHAYASIHTLPRTRAVNTGEYIPSCPTNSHTKSPCTQE